jgi:hypothetical protein
MNMSNNYKNNFGKWTYLKTMKSHRLFITTSMELAIPMELICIL